LVQLKTKYWDYFRKLCARIETDIDALRIIISNLEVDHQDRLGEYTIKLIAKKNEDFGTVYTIEVYEKGSTLILKSPVLLFAPRRPR
jgi:hypothetical protein